MPAATPAEVAAASVTTFPEKVLDVVNALLVKNYRSGRDITLWLEEVKVALMAAFPEVNRSDLIHLGWLDFESIYQAAGWTVVFDSPSFGDNYPAFYTFSK